jgi:transketolase
MSQELTALAVNAIRILSMDAVQQADSGHPGAPMGLAAVAYTIWTRHLRHAPQQPAWPDRDRFVLSNGHASMLLYSLLHLTGYEAMTLDQIKNFRQWGSLTPGHPERELTPGVEVTTGPLGQGIATAVGLAIAEAQLAATSHDTVDHHTYVICSDGDLMEGVSHEAAALAGHLGLGKLVVVWDDNKITIDGATDISFTEDTLARFAAYGWHTSRVTDGNDVQALDDAISAAKAVTDRPSIIAARTTIGYGSPNKAGKSSSHGSPLGKDEIAKARAQLGWPHDEPFFVPQEVYAHMDARPRGEQLLAAWDAKLTAYRAAQPEAAAVLERRLSGALPAGWTDALPTFAPDKKGTATRNSSGKVLERVMATLPELVGGSADLAGSNKTLFPAHGIFDRASRSGQNVHFGVREHGMGAAVNGMTLHGGLRAYGATFLVFSDYMRPALRLAALMHVPSISVFTHDSIGLGEDGPTHQPIEHMMALRSIPNFVTLRPADANEVRESWIAAIERTGGPSALVLTRQDVPTFDRAALGSKGDATRGGYILADAPEGQAPAVILIGTGSEVTICMEARELLAASGVHARVVSLPSWELFAAQDKAWRDEVLPPAITARVSIEAGRTLGWERFVGTAGVAIGLDHFGASAPFELLYERFGLTAARVAEAARSLI